MSDIHVLEGNDNGEFQVVFHITIPDATNSVGINYRTALVNSGLGGTTSLVEGTAPGQIAAAEKLQVEAGEIYEWTSNFTVEGNGTTSIVARDLLRAKYTREAAIAISKLQNQLKYFGYTESEN